MADPVLVPPTPTINQSDSPEEIQRVGENIQKIFDKVAPKRGEKAVSAPVETSKPPEAPKVTKAPPAPPFTEKLETKAEPPAPEPKAEDKPADAHKVPSFIEKALSAEPVKTETPPPAAVPDVSDAIADFPDELPPEERKNRVKNLRDEYRKLKDQVKVLNERPPVGVDEVTKQKLEFLENQNKEMSQVLARTNVEHHVEFQNKILRPMNAAWQEAARIVKETGGDPEELGKALALGGKAHFEALDSIFEGMPESAKIEANNAVAAYRRGDAARRQWLADAPRVQEQLKKSDLEQQYRAISQQKEEMRGMFDTAIRKLREEAKVEVLQKSTDPDASWWNEQADKIEETAKSVFLENTDMQKVAYACALAPMVDVYRKLWISEREARAKSDKIIKERFGSEPSMSESGGNVRDGISTPEEDLKKPFKDIFLREFHKQRNAGVR